MENIKLLSSKVFLSEDNNNPDSFIAKFVICDFGRNKNGVALDRSHIEEWISTLKNKPLVGKIKKTVDGEFDFTSHNMSIVKVTDEEGNEYEEAVFDTDAFGTFFDVSIEDVDGTECIVASCEIWKRFSKACEIIINRIQEGTLYTSWEISVDKTRQDTIDGLVTKVIEAGRFMGHCLLSKLVAPAYDSSRMLEIASEEEFEELSIAEALLQDMNSVEDTKSTKEEQKLDNEKVIVTSEGNGEVTTPEVGTEVSEDITKNNPETSENVTPEGTPETASLTAIDIECKLSDTLRSKSSFRGHIAYLFPEEHYCLTRCWDDDELNYTKYNYSVNGNEVTVEGEGELVTLTISVRNINSAIAEQEKTVAEKDELIVKASAEINELKAQITELSQYKEKFEQAEQERIAQELADKKEELIASIVKSGQITREEIAESEELTSYVNNLDKASLMALVGERLISSIETKPEVETSSVNEKTELASVNLNANSDDEDVTNNASSIMRKYIGK